MQARGRLSYEVIIHTGLLDFHSMTSQPSQSVSVCAAPGRLPILTRNAGQLMANPYRPYLLHMAFMIESSGVRGARTVRSGPNRPRSGPIYI
jgi:hypothetical protein